MPSIQQDITAIRTAVYGEEVREAIADGIEHCYDDVTTSTTTADSAATRANTAAERSETINSELGNAADAIVLVQDTQPTEEFNKIWVKPESDEYPVPTYEEFENLRDSIALSDAEENSFYNAISKFAGVRVAKWETSVSITIPAEGSVATYERTPRSDICLACVMDVEPGEKLYYSGTGGTTSIGVAYGFTDSEGTVLRRGSSNYSGEFMTTVPFGVKKVILNNRTTAENPYAFIGSRLDQSEPKLLRYTETLNGGSNVNLTEFSGTIAANGATVEYDDGRLKIYNNTSGTRYLLCLNGQKSVISSGAAFQQTVPAGVYAVHFKAYGYTPNSGSYPLAKWTTSTFENGTYIRDGDIIESSEPIMAGIWLVNNYDYGTSEDPMYFEFSLTEYKQKVNAEDFSSFVSSVKLPTLDDVANLFTDGVLAAGEYYIKGYPYQDSPIMLKMQSMYTETNGSGAPTVQFECRGASGGRLFFSHRYSIESDTEYRLQEWRIPNNFITNYIYVIIRVPEGSSLSIKSFYCKYIPYVSIDTPRIIFHAHRGLEKFWPSDTYNSIVAAAEIGFKSCIVIPKFTSDGVAVCFHNDGGSSSPLSAYLKMPDGSEVPELEDQTKKISDFTYAELMQWSMGVVKANAYADQKILTMDDFLRICAETGMRPIYSIHPTLTVEQWAALKVLLDKYNLASQLSVKDGDTITWTRVNNTFGDGGVYSIISLSTSAIDQVTKINNWKSAQGVTKTRVDAEWMAFDPTDATYVTRTQEAKAAGIIVSAVLGSEDTGDYIKACIANGITEFTNCRHCSMGLNW